MDKVTIIINLILRSVIVVVVCAGFILVLYAVYIRGVKGEFAILSALFTLVLTIFSGLVIASKQAKDASSPNPNNDTQGSEIDNNKPS